MPHISLKVNGKYRYMLIKQRFNEIYAINFIV